MIYIFIFICASTLVLCKINVSSIFVAYIQACFNMYYFLLGHITELYWWLMGTEQRHYFYDYMSEQQLSARKRILLFFVLK